MSFDSTYLDMNKFAKDTEDFFVKVSSKWVNETAKMAEAITDGTIDVKSFSKALKELNKGFNNLKEINEKFSEELSELVADMVGQAYVCGYTEGSYNNTKEMVDSYHELVDEGYLDEDKKMQEFINVLASVSESHFAELNKGKPLNIPMDNLFKK